MRHKTTFIYSFSCTPGFDINEIRDTPGKPEERPDCIFSTVLVRSKSLLSHDVGFGGTLLLFVGLDTLCRYVG